MVEDGPFQTAPTVTSTINPLLSLLRPCVRIPGVTIDCSLVTSVPSHRSAHAAATPQNDCSASRDGELITRCLAQVFGTAYSHLLHRTTTSASVKRNEHIGSSGASHFYHSELPLLHSATGAHASAYVRHPDPKDIATSFYGNRHDAVVAWGYCSPAVNTGGGSAPSERLVPIAVDLPNGSSAKRYQCIPQTELPQFVASIPDPLRRNVYTLIDDMHPCDPFFDIDGDLKSLPMDAVNMMIGRHQAGSDASSVDVHHATLEAILAACLTFLTAKLREYFTQSRTRRTMGAPSAVAEPYQTLVLTASSCQEQKLSFHIHMRWRCVAHHEPLGRDGGTTTTLPCMFQSVMEHKHFADVLEAELKRLASGPDTGDSVLSVDRATAQLLLVVLDLSVYSRWRALRLPYNIKSVNVTDIVQRAESAPKLSTVLSTTDAAASVLTLCASPGATAACICVGCADVTNNSIRTALLHRLRPLLPLSGDRDTDLVKGLLLKALDESSCIKADEHHKSFVEMCFDLALVTRRSLGGFRSSSSFGSKRQRSGSREEIDNAEAQDYIIDERSSHIHENGDSSAAPYVVVEYDSHHHGDSVVSSESIPAPFPTGRRQPLNSPAARTLMWRLFQCLHPTGFQNLRPDHLNVVFEDAGQRYWYVYQKQNRYCLNLARDHKQTCGQLYLTYGSIKFRCYSNDCCRVPCWRRSWGVDVAEPVAPPQTEEDSIAATLREIHGKLFPELDEQQLRLRFPSYLLEPSAPAGARNSEVPEPGPSPPTK
jgi:hypothetical protein